MIVSDSVIFSFEWGMSSHHMSWCEEVKVASALNYTHTFEQNVDDIDFDFLNMFEWFFILILYKWIQSNANGWGRTYTIISIQSFFFIVEI